MSLGEDRIKHILQKEHIKYEKEKVFTDLRNGAYRFDFYLPEKNIAIEFNGAQHYEFTPFFYTNRSEYLKAKERDRRKISYCLAHQIKLYCVPYWEYDHIHTSSDLFQKKFLATSKFHNDVAFKKFKQIQK